MIQTCPTDDATEDGELCSLATFRDDDFFAYANGGWLRATAIPAGKNRWTARNEIEELTRRRIARLLDNAGAEPVGSTGRKVANFRAAYLNEDAIEAGGHTPLKPAAPR